MVFSSLATASTSLQQAATHIARELNNQLSLRGRTIQCAPASFREEATGRTYPLSRQIYDELSASLARHGAVLSLQEQGNTPLLLLGNYLVHKNTVVLTVRLRRMGEGSSSDVAVSRESFSPTGLPEAMIADSLEAASVSLVRQLEQQAIMTDTLQIAVSQSTPLHTGQPTLKLGQSLERALVHALKNSSVFGEITIGEKSQAILLLPQYEISNGVVRLVVQFPAHGFERKGLVQTEIAAKAISPDLLLPFNDHHFNVCLRIAPRGRLYISEQSTEGLDLLAFLQGKLITPYAINASTCTKKAGSSRKLVVSVKKQSGQTPDGYGFIRAASTVQIIDSDGQNKGFVQQTATVNKTVYMSSNDALFDKLFPEKDIMTISQSALLYP